MRTKADGRRTAELTVKVPTDAELRQLEGRWTRLRDNITQQGDKYVYDAKRTEFTLAIRGANASDLGAYRFAVRIKPSQVWCPVTANVSLLLRGTTTTTSAEDDEKCPAQIVSYGDQAVRVSTRVDKLRQQASSEAAVVQVWFDFAGDDSILRGEWRLPSGLYHQFQFNETRQLLGRRYNATNQRASHLLRNATLRIPNVAKADLGEYVFRLSVRGKQCRQAGAVHVYSSNDGPRTTEAAVKVRRTNANVQKSPSKEPDSPATVLEVVVVTLMVVASGVVLICMYIYEKLKQSRT